MRDDRSSTFASNLDPSEQLGGYLEEGTEVVVRRGTLAGMAGSVVRCDEVGRCLVRLAGRVPGVYLAVAAESLFLAPQGPKLANPECRPGSCT